MATRFYLPSSGTSPLPSLAVANWAGSVSTFFRAPAVRDKSNTALTDFAARFLSTTSQSDCWGQWASEALPDAFGFTTGHTASIVVRGFEDNAAVNSLIACKVRVVSGDGATVRGTLLSYTGSGAEFVTTAETRIISAKALTAVSAQAGDRIVIEVGCSATAPSTSYDMTLRFGDPSGTADFALTSGLTTDLCPWLELSCDPFATSSPVPVNLLHSQIRARGVRVYG